MKLGSSVCLSCPPRKGPRYLCEREHLLQEPSYTSLLRHEQSLFHSKQPLENCEPTAVYSGNTNISRGSHSPCLKWATSPVGHSFLPVFLWEVAAELPGFLWVSFAEDTQSRLPSFAVADGLLRVPKLSGIPWIRLWKFRANLWLSVGERLIWSRGTLLCDWVMKRY